MNTQTKINSELLKSIQDGVVVAELTYPANTKYVSRSDDRITSVTTTDDGRVIMVDSTGVYLNEALLEDVCDILEAVSLTGFHLIDEFTLSDANSLISITKKDLVRTITVGERSLTHDENTNSVTINGYETTNTYTLHKDITRKEMWTKITSWMIDINPESK